VERDELQQLLRTASEEHERTRELLGPQRGPGGWPADAQSRQTGSPVPAPVASSLLEARLVWILGSPRSGSSWLMRLLGERSEVATIDESYLGTHLVPLSGTTEAGEYFEHGQRAEDPSYFFARRYLPVFRPLLRELVLRGLENQIRHLNPGPLPRWLVIKEPNGSHAADTLVSLLPSSRMLFLLRDGRDVVDSLVDAMFRDKTWWKDRASFVRPPQQRTSFVSQHAGLWVRRTMASQRAFAALPDDQRLLVRYEELLSDTPAQLRRIFDWLDVDVGEGDVEAIVASNAFEAVPKRRRGPGKAVRAATPGLWRRNLTPEEQQTMDEIMGDKLRELGYEA
jgi:Sulfotransferase family